MDLQDYFNQEVKREKERMRRKLIYAFSMLIIVHALAIAMFHYAEGWSWEESVYFTSATMTTVGYGDLVPHTQLGKMLTIPLMWIGIAVGFYLIYTLMDYGKSHVEGRMGRAMDSVDGFRGKGEKGKKD